MHCNMNTCFAVCGLFYFAVVSSLLLFVVLHLLIFTILEDSVSSVEVHIQPFQSKFQISLFLKDDMKKLKIDLPHY